MIFELADASERPGYLPYDGQLAGLANARSATFFKSNVVGLLEAGFKTVQLDGREWIYNERLLVILEEQKKKMRPEEVVISSSLLSKANFIDIEGLDLQTKNLFDHYLKLFERDKRYRLTSSRQKKAEMRLLEYMADEQVGLEGAVIAAKGAMANLASSEFHVEGGYFDWIDHLFGSRDIFQKRLDMKVKAKQSNGASVGMGLEAAKLYCWNCKRAYEQVKDKPVSLFCSEECATEDKAKLASASRGHDLKRQAEGK